MPPAAQPQSGPRRAAFTIASRDRMGGAKLLAERYRTFHPEQRFFIVMADDLGKSPAGGAEGGLIPLGEIALPGADVFPYQHGMRALCAAVKPFCMRQLLGFADIDQLMYLDADIDVFRRLDDAWDALHGANVVLTPHARHQIADAAMPSDRTFLQRGLFNLGFIAMKDHADTRDFLDWWCERVYTDCPAEPTDGLYLDQKWLDLAPLYFEGIHALTDDTCNVAYWNLHERTLTGSGEGYLVNGRPLSFYHFSGFDPARPAVMSVHQSRYHLSELPVAKRLHDSYAQALNEVDGPYLTLRDRACIRLGNGVPMSRLASAVVLHCVRNSIDFPAPGSAPRAFCDFLTTPNPAVFGAHVAPLVTALLDARPDVEAAFPGARQDKHHKGLGHWLQTCGAEENLEDLLRDFGVNLQRSSPLARALEIYQWREDLQAAFPDVFGDDTSFVRYGQWLDTYGRIEEGVDDDVLSGYLAAPEGARRVVQQFFSHPELPGEFPALYGDEAITGLAARITRLMGEFYSIDADDVLAFEAFAKSRRHELLLACLRYNPRARDQIGGAPSLLNAGKIESFLGRQDALEELPVVVATLLEGHWITPGSQLRAFLGASPQAQAEPTLTATGLADLLRPAVEMAEQLHTGGDPLQWDDWADQALQACTSPLQPGVNLHGPLRDSTGMGEWARSYARILEAARIPHRRLPFPSRVPTPEALLETSLPALFGAVDDSLDINVIVANAHSMVSARDWLPDHVFQGRCNVGCWIWETESLPRRFSEYSKGLHAIISASSYSVEAIQRSVDIPVYKVHCALDFDFLGTASPNRASFGLPDDTVLFGFFFDAKSVIERKNPAGLIAAFRAAFGTRRDVGLVLKVNCADPGNVEYDSLKSQASELNVFWIERTLSLKDTVDLMASLDVYASLHRSEGFGLTMAEAMALGKPVIATGYSGNLEFMDAASACLVDHAVINTTRPHGPYLSGSRWAEPSIEHCAQWMRSLADRESRGRIAMAGRSRVHEVLHPERIAGRMQETLDDIRGRWHARSG